MFLLSIVRSPAVLGGRFTNQKIGEGKYIMPGSERQRPGRGLMRGLEPLDLMMVCTVHVCSICFVTSSWPPSFMEQTCVHLSLHTKHNTVQCDRRAGVCICGWSRRTLRNLCDLTACDPHAFRRRCLTPSLELCPAGRPWQTRGAGVYWPPAWW